jgi:iron complex outermembrane receptor protein
MNLSVTYPKGEWTKMVIPASHLHPQVWPEVSLAGTRSANTPKLSITADYEHNFMLGSLGVLTPSIDAQYKTAYELRFNPGQEDTSGYGHQEYYFLWSGSVIFNSSSGKWSLNGSVKNIFNYAVKKSYMAQGGLMLMLGDPGYIRFD